MTLFTTAIILVLGYLYFTLSSKNDLFEDFKEIDKLILEGDFENSIEKLDILSRDIPDRYNCYKLIKRSIEISELSGDFNIFLRVSKRAVSKYSGNEDLQAYYVMALLKTGEYEVAYDVANKFLLSDEFKPLLAQAVLYYNSRENNRSIISYLDNQREPSFYEYLAVALEDDSLLINSALLWAKSGDIEKAYNLLKDIQTQEIQEAIALLAYDSGRESEALQRLLELPSSDSIKYYNQLLIADLFYTKENWSRSKYYYESALKIDNTNPYAYINISSIYKMHSKYKKASLTLNSGIDVFKHMVNDINMEIVNLKDDFNNEKDRIKKDLTNRLLDKKIRELNDLKKSYRELVLLFYSINRKNRSNEAIRVLQEFRLLFPEDVKIELLLMKSLDNVTSPDIFEAKLWKLLNSDNDNKDVAEYLVWYFLGLENYDNVNLIIERSNNIHPDNSWTNYYEGIIEAIHGDYERAIKLMDNPNISIPLWEVLYNRGVVEMAMVNYPEALTLFNKSYISLNSYNLIDDIDIYRSQIKTKIAEVLINLDDIDEAIRVLNHAIELDPNNYRSDLLKSVHLNIKERE